MTKRFYLKSLVLGIGLALLLSLLALLGLSRVADLGASQHREEFFGFLAESLEQKIAGLSDGDIRKMDMRELLEPGPPGFGSRGNGRFGSGHPPFPMPPPPPRDDFGPGMPPPPGPRRPGGPRFDFWIVDKDGQVLQSRGQQSLEFDWAQATKPTEPRKVVARDDFFRIQPGTYIVLLDRTPSTYLVIQEGRRFFQGPMLMAQVLTTFATVLAALILSASITFVYLRRKSSEARGVLRRLEQGDLKARFEIKRLDEFGSLLLDFNRMADEIERLVSRLHAAESARKELLQELGHDVRTPLTSLTTSFETFRQHHHQMTEAQRNEIGDMIGAEIEYLKELIEKLMQIASIDEPHYKRSTERLDLHALLEAEIRGRSQTSPHRWSLAGGSACVMGDPHLILRLFKNAFDNAARFAQREVAVDVVREAGGVLVRVLDDGSGLSSADLESFGKRREQRIRREGSRLNFSLGLGSIIMKTIAELHEGRVEIVNRDGGAGAELRVWLPVV